MSEIQQLLNDYANGADALRAELTLISEDDWDAVPVPGKWSIRQVICHLADSEIIYADRIKRTIAEDNPSIMDADPNVFLPALHCSQRDLLSEVEMVALIRSHVGVILGHCDIEDFQRTCVHSADGAMTLETLVERITGHIPHHIRFIQEKVQALART